MNAIIYQPGGEQDNVFICSFEVVFEISYKTTEDFRVVFLENIHCANGNTACFDGPKSNGVVKVGRSFPMHYFHADGAARPHQADNT